MSVSGAIPFVMEVMHVNKLTSVALMVGALSMASVAFGQERKWDFTPYGYSFRIGVAFPQDNGLKQGDDTFTALGVDFNFGSSVIRRGDSFLSVDMVAREFDGSGGTVWPIMFNNRFYIRGAEDQRTYFIGGIGLNVMDFDDTDYELGARFGMGLELSQQMFLQGTYTFGRKNSDGVRPDHFGVYLGYRF